MADVDINGDHVLIKYLKLVRDVDRRIGIKRELGSAGELIQELKGLKGGKKQFWLRVHRKQVENFNALNGPDATMAEFGMSQETYDRFMERKGADDRVNKLSQNDRYVLNMANEKTRAVAQELRQLENEFDEFRQRAEPVIALGEALISATKLGIIAKVESPTALKDPLDIRRLLEKSDET